MPGYFVPPAFVNIQWKTYVLFAVFCAAMFLHVFFMFPETAGKTLEEVESIFTDPEGIPYIGTPAWKTKNARSQIVRLEKGMIDEEEKEQLKRQVQTVQTAENKETPA